MKTIITLFTLLFAISSYAQNSFEFSYDAAGNRTSRKVITLNPQKKGEVVEDQVVGINFTLNPNPTAGKMLILTDEAFSELEDREVFVYDLRGQIIYSEKITQNEIEIDLSNQPTGSYIVKLTARDFVHDWKVVKM